MKSLLTTILLFACLQSFSQVNATRLRFWAGGVSTNVGGGGGSALTNSVVAHWEMKADTSANEVDEMGTNDVAVSAGDTIPSIAGVVGNGRDFEAGDDDYLYGPDSPELSMSGGDQSFTVNLWCALESVGANFYLVAKGEEYNVNFASSGSTMRFQVYGSVTNQVTGGNIGTGTNYMVSAVHDSTNNIIAIYIRDPSGVRYTELAHSGGTADAASELWIGSLPTAPTLNWDGMLDEVTIFKRAVSSNELNTLYNSGSGRAWPWTGL